MGTKRKSTKIINLKIFDNYFAATKLIAANKYFEILHSNMADPKEGSPISIEHLLVHVMAKGNCYDLKQRKFFADIPVLKISQ